MSFYQFTVPADSATARKKGRGGHRVMLCSGPGQRGQRRTGRMVQAGPWHRGEVLATQLPELTLRVEAAHRAAYFDLGPGGQSNCR